MNENSRTLLLSLLLPLLASCDRQSKHDAISKHERMLAANARLLSAYVGTNIVAAEEALLDYRKEVLSTDGFRGLIDVHKELNLVDGRLFSINMHRGDKSNATVWFNSSISNLNLARLNKDRPPNNNATTGALEETICKLDEPIHVGWRTNMSSAVH